MRRLQPAHRALGRRMGGHGHGRMPGHQPVRRPARPRRPLPHHPEPTPHLSSKRPDMNTPVVTGERWYHGKAASERRAGPRAIAIENAAGHRLGALTHRPRHSPTGMTWGYAGSGPADLARSILI